MTEAMAEPRGVPWSRLAAEEPDLAARIEARFSANLHHVIGTIRPDGSPRLSGTEVRIADGQVTVGMMSKSQKLRDVHRNPCVEIHSAPLEDDLALGDAKLAGVLTGASAVSGPVDGVSYHLEISLASLVRVEGDALLFTVWRPGEEARRIRRR